MTKRGDCSCSDSCRCSQSLLFPLALLTLAFFAQTAFQNWQLLLDRAVIMSARGEQETPLKQSQDVRKQLEAIAISVQELASEGNPNAKAVVETLQRAGVTINTGKNAASK